MKSVKSNLDDICKGYVLGVLTLLLLVSSAGAAPYAYIANYDSNNVSVIDTATNAVITSVSVGRTPVGVAVNPAGTRVYVANYFSSNVSVIDTATNAVITSVSVGNNPMGVAVNPAGTRVYVTIADSNTVSVIDTSTNAVINTVSVGSSPFGVAVNPEGTRVYVDNYLGNTVSVINTSTNAVITTVSVGRMPNGVTVNPAGTRVYVANSGSNTVSVIDTATNAVITNVGVGLWPVTVAVNPEGTRMYVDSYLGNLVYEVDTATNAVITTVNVGSETLGVGVNPAGTRVYAVNLRRNTVSVIDTATNAVTATINVGRSPYGYGKFIGPDDATPPITIDNSPAAWQEDTFTVTLSCSDNPGGSGCKETKYRIDSGTWQTGNSISISTEGDHQIEYYSIDNANNQETPTKFTHAKLDKTGPTISITTPSNGADYILNQLITADYGCSDDLSGVATCTGTVANGANIDTGTVDSKSFTVTSTDGAGNTASLTYNYNVIYNFAGFFSPVDNIPTMNAAKAGQTIPLKWRLLDANNVPITNLATVEVTAVSLTCPLGETPDQIEEYAAGSSGLQNLGDGYYQFNWKTPKMYAGSCKTLNLDLGDDLLQKALFEFKK